MVGGDRVLAACSELREAKSRRPPVVAWAMAPKIAPQTAPTRIVDDQDAQPAGVAEDAEEQADEQAEPRATGRAGERRPRGGQPAQDVLHQAQVGARRWLVFSTGNLLSDR